MNYKNKLIVIVSFMFGLSLLIFTNLVVPSEGQNNISYNKNIKPKNTKEQELVTLEVEEVIKTTTAYIPEKTYSDEEINLLCRLVECEAKAEGIMGKLMVANVIINRVNSPNFPNTITEVIYQKNDRYYQFQPVANGKINRVEVTQETIDAVNRAIYNGEDYSEGALYFMNLKIVTDRQTINWIRNSLTKLFTYENHTFYK